MLYKKKDKLSRKIRLVQPYPITYQFRPEEEFLGKKLIEMMTEKFPFRKKKEWEERIDSGKVYVNSNKVSPQYKLLSGDIVYHHNPKVIEPSVPDEIEILKEEDDYLVVYKPAPMPMHAGGRYFKNSLLEILKEKGFENLRITHRLDAVTSGIVLIAKTKEFANAAMNCFSEGKVEKTYLAIVEGVPNQKKITITASIKRKNGFVFECDNTLTDARKAITHFEVIETYINSALVKCIPETGRTHQIRLHLAKWGHPIVDDPIYGKDGDRSGMTMQNQAISLESTGIRIPELGVDLTLS